MGSGVGGTKVEVIYNRFLADPIVQGDYKSLPSHLRGVIWIDGKPSIGRGSAPCRPMFYAVAQSRSDESYMLSALCAYESVFSFHFEGGQTRR